MPKDPEKPKKTNRIKKILLDSDLDYRIIFNATSNLMSFTELESGKIVEVNNAWLAAAGINRENAIGKSALELGLWISKDDREKCFTELNKKGRIINFETSLIMNSKKLPYLITAELVEIGNKKYVLWELRDLTEQKKMNEVLIKNEEKVKALLAESERSRLVLLDILENEKKVKEALWENENIFASFLESSPVYIFFKDKDIRSLRLSKNYEEMLGMSLSHLLGKTMDELFPSDLAKNMVEDDLRILNQGKKVVAIEELNGRIYETTKFPIFKNNQPVMLAGFTIDITERKKAEEALIESENRYKKLVSSLTDFIYSVNIKKGNPSSVQYSPGCISVTGYSSYEFENDQLLWFYIIFDEDKELIKKLSSRLIDGEEVKPFEHRIIHKNGLIRWVRNSYVIRKNKMGELEGYDGLIEDITERKLAEDEIKKLNLELEGRVEKRTVELASANKELEAFSYSVSHDLRAPLRAMNGFSTLLLEGYLDKVDQEGQKYLKMIKAGSEKMDHLITDLLELSKVTRLEINFSKIDMNFMVNTIYNEIASPADKEMFNFEIIELPEIVADPRLIRQVWENLISNAIKYSMKSEVKKIQVSGYIEGERNIYYIKDYGAGFNSDYSHKLYGVFQRLHSAEEFDGTGVGLAIVQRIIQRHNGKVWAEGEINKGATFYFSLPRKIK